MIEHTPTPWEYIKSTLRDESDNGIFDIRSTPFNEETGFVVAETVGGLDDGEEEANAAFIVKCVNMHDDLIQYINLLNNVLMALHAAEPRDEVRKIIGELIIANQAALERVGEK